MELVAKSSGFGKRLKELREAAGLSQYELAKRSEVSGASLSRIERGDRDPSWETVLKLARALNVTVAEFDTGADPREQEHSSIDDQPPESASPAKKPKK